MWSEFGWTDNKAGTVADRREYKVLVFRFDVMIDDMAKNRNLSHHIGFRLEN